MREIKFRAWDGDDMYYHESQGDDYYFEVNIDGLNLVLNCQEFEFGSGAADEKWVRRDVEAEFMQYTGIKDKNGKSIYESDIISDHVGIGVVKYSDKHAAFRVSYGDGYAKWFYDYILKGEIESIEVIGNIHQHPELLESK